MLKRFLSSRREPAHVPTMPPGQRVYAIGDVHGRLDLVDLLLAQIADDDRRRGPADTTFVFLGDLVDRGPDSAGVVERVIALRESGAAIRVLMGNHEEVFLAALDGSREAIRGFCRIGGRETILSYGITPAEYERYDFDEVAARLSAGVPARHRAFLEAMESVVEIGDYAFVHAGIRPGVPLSEQRGRDLRWIREPFLSYRGVHERIIVHGHTISDEVERTSSRIGIDTGAYMSGRLTAVGLENADQWFVSTVARTSAAAA